MYDTNGIGHTSTTLNVSVKADSCTCSKNSSCKPCGWLIPDFILMIAECHEYCLTCFGLLNTQCKSCANSTTGTEYLLTVTTCDAVCGDSYFKSGPNMCSPCAKNCTTCDVTLDNCSLCNAGYVYWPVPATGQCPKSCPAGYYYDNNTVQCEPCDPSCAICSAFPTPCSYCNVSYFLLGDACIQPCPAAYYENVVNRTCENCSIYCVGDTISFYQPKGGSSGLNALYIDLNFTEDVNFADFPMSTFQTISFTNSAYDVSMFNITYTPITLRCYRISLTPLGFAFLVN